MDEKPNHKLVSRAYASVFYYLRRQDMAQLEVSDFAQAVIDRMGDCKDARFKQIMTALVKHAHAFAREVDLTPDEWMAGQKLP